ncbi:PAS domain S-box protein [bacterium]|nr:PAS domain S-box protein [bacterium]
MGQINKEKSGKAEGLKRVEKTRLPENLPGVIYRCANDRDWTMLDISNGCIDLLEYQPEDLIDDKIVSYGDLIVPEDRDLVFTEVQKAINEHKSYIIEYRIRTSSGKIKWVWEQGIGVFSDDGELLSLEGYITELTESRVMSKEEKYRLLVENIKDAIVISQFDRFIFFNEQFATMLGYTVAELTMKDYRDVYTVRGVEILRERSARRNRGEDVSSQYETVFKRKDGSDIDVEANVSIIQYKGSVATFAVIRDISDRKKVDLEIQKQKQYFEALYTSSPGAIVSLDMKHRIVNVNPQFERLFGHPLQEIEGKNIDDLIVPKDFLKDAKDTTKLIEKGGVAVKEAKRLKKDGTLVDVSIGGAPIIVDGKQIGIIAIYMDISLIREAEEEIRKQKQYFEALFTSASDAIVSLDLQGNVVSVNPFFEKLFGYTQVGIQGKNLDSFIVSGDSLSDASNITKAVQAGGITRFERKRKREDGSFVDVSVSGAPIIVDGEHVGALAIYRDISERKKAEEERERMISELQEALRKVNTLSGLIPICANCKKIRDDQGYWSDVELYISKHSAAEFSHGLCNDCMKKLYPEQYDRLRSQGKLKGN